LVLNLGRFLHAFLQILIQNLNSYVALTG
jgi:hypothetical protein